MEIIINPDREQWAGLLQRPVSDPLVLTKKVRKVLDKVKAGGDKVLRKLTKEFDGVKLKQAAVTEKEIEIAIATLDPELVTAIGIARDNIEKFHRSQLITEPVIETMPGVQCWRKSVGIEKVGIYIPGGTAPLFSTVLMLAIPARLAGCKDIILCTPPQKDGRVNAAILYAAKLAGITQLFKAGGAQAIGAMAYGTESIPKVYKIVGPGNQYVTCAKQLVQMENTAIDMPAGPSEVCVLADETAEPSFVAADLLSQAEHGADSQVLLVTTNASLADAVQKELDIQLKRLPRSGFALQSLAASKAIVVNNMTEAIELVNEYAAEHLIICCADEDAIAARISNAGSIFLGNYSPESVGDYASGTNHTLPTNGFAKAYSGVSVDSFIRKITYQKLTVEGLRSIGNTVKLMARAEGLEAHAQAVQIRLEKIRKS